MQHVKLWKIHLLICCFIVGVGVAACVQTPAVLPPPSPPAQTATTTPAEETPASDAVQPAHIAQESPLPSPTQTPSVAEWQVFTHTSGISFQFPGDWQLADLWDDGTGGKIKSVYSVQPLPDGYINHIGIIIESLPKDRVLALLHRAGEIIDPDAFFGPILGVQ